VSLDSSALEVKRLERIVRYQLANEVKLSIAEFFATITYHAEAGQVSICFHCSAISYGRKDDKSAGVSPPFSVHAERKRHSQCLGFKPCCNNVCSSVNVQTVKVVGQVLPEP
jgi:hypothetical protein